MAEELFGDRRKALEEAFFAKENEKLQQQLRVKREGEAKKQALAAASGITDEAVLNQLVALGIGSETVAALALVPLVLVAWADGSIDEKERTAVLAAAESRGIAGQTPAYQLVGNWLSQRPDQKLLTTWSEFVAALASTLDEEARTALKQDILTRARGVAEVAGGFLGVGRKVSTAEEAVLERLAEVFQ